jgi:DNA-binding transcriptional MocR family regulator
MPDGITWEYPSGGLFVWCRLPAGYSTNELLSIAVEEQVQFAPGAPYFPQHKSYNYMRLNFAMNTPEKNEEGIIRLSRAITQYFDIKTNRAKKDR